MNNYDVLKVHYQMKQEEIEKLRIEHTFTTKRRSFSFRMVLNRFKKDRKISQRQQGCCPAI
ncbi:hypothetical protein [Bacillus suaedae]|uniref:Uncharacterized protein n=1 Tax=Halalkalibacter suaedae TaxID=2822140 RepID=A0A940WTK0_9BACI|nr:hypothetical protein [Bacillus suaedae]MBP3950387.1 hypothetical protein [Bacillus suaedae]